MPFSRSAPLARLCPSLSPSSERRAGSPRDTASFARSQRERKLEKALSLLGKWWRERRESRGGRRRRCRRRQSRLTVAPAAAPSACLSAPFPHYCGRACRSQPRWYVHSWSRIDVRGQRRGRFGACCVSKSRTNECIQFFLDDDQRRQREWKKTLSLRLLPLSSLLSRLLSRALTNSSHPARNSETRIQKRQNAAQAGSDDVSAPSSASLSPSQSASSSSSSSSPSSSSDASSPSSRAPRRDWRPNAFQKNDDELQT